jgi:hypothetical protein
MTKTKRVRCAWHAVCTVDKPYTHKILGVKISENDHLKRITVDVWIL